MKSASQRRQHALEIKVPVVIDSWVDFGQASVTYVSSEFSVSIPFEGDQYVSLALLQGNSQTGIRLIKGILPGISDHDVYIQGAFDHIHMLICAIQILIIIINH